MYVESGYVESGYTEGDFTGRYVDDGYVENGYVEGDDAYNTGDKIPLRFFVALNSNDVENAVSLLNDGEVGVVYAPFMKKLFMIGKDFLYEFASTNVDEVVSAILGDSEILNSLAAAIVSKTSIVDTVKDAVVGSMKMSVSFYAQDGTYLDSLQVSREGTSFVFEVPEDLSGLDYKVRIDIA